MIFKQIILLQESMKYSFIATAVVFDSRIKETIDSCVARSYFLMQKFFSTTKPYNCVPSKVNWEKKF